MIPSTPEANQLLLDGAKALSQVEANGIRVDTDYLDRALERTDKRIKKIQQRLREHEVYQVWRRRYGAKTNLGSREQLAKVLFDDLGYESNHKTNTGRHKMDESVLLDIPNGFVKGMLKLEKLKKVHGTYLKGIKREVRDGRVHGVCNLHTARTFRSSFDSPNLQNMPIRDPEQGKIVRQCFIPSKGHVLVEIDYGQIEVRAAAWYHKDPTMLEYIEDTTKDMHRDMAAQCYKVGTGEVTKSMRHAAKNKFVFPQFYGDYYINCSKNLWNDSSSFKEVRGSFSKGLGICNSKQPPIPGTFEYHIKQVEHDFWKKRFAQYDKWKQSWWEQYLERGWIQMLTGFVISGMYTRNEIINSPIQGVAFHCLLWSLIRLQRLLRKLRMRSMIVVQVHDSMLLDAYIPELSDVLEMAKQIMTEEIRKHWRWIITSLAVEAEVSDKTWHDKQEVEI